MKAEDEKYCVECGQAIHVKAEVCPFCGVRQPIFYANQPFQQQNRSLQDDRWLPALLFCFFSRPVRGASFLSGSDRNGSDPIGHLRGLWNLVAD